MKLTIREMERETGFSGTKIRAKLSKAGIKPVGKKTIETKLTHGSAIQKINLYDFEQIKAVLNG
jgi:hypothetical protein